MPVVRGQAGKLQHADDFWAHERATYQGSKGGLHKDSTVLRLHV